MTESRSVLTGDGGRQEGILEGMAKEHEETFRVMGRFPILVVVMVSWFYGCMFHVSKFIKLYTLYVCRLFYASYTSIKQINKTHTGLECFPDI